MFLGFIGKNRSKGIAKNGHGVAQLAGVLVKCENLAHCLKKF